VGLFEEENKSVLNRDLPRDLLERMEGPRPPDDFVSNGCSKSPDHIGANTLQPACHFHDFGYMLWPLEKQGGTERDRMEIDAMFYRNLMRCGLSQYLAYRYFIAVRMVGYRHYVYRDGEEPQPGLRFTLWLFLRSFIRW
jgi:hypothetical protein